LWEKARIVGQQHRELYPVSNREKIGLVGQSPDLTTLREDCKRVPSPAPKCFGCPNGQSFQQLLRARQKADGLGKGFMLSVAKNSFVHHFAPVDRITLRGVSLRSKFAE
jgi:hypothetical protein